MALCDKCLKPLAVDTANGKDRVLVPGVTQEMMNRGTCNDCVAVEKEVA